MKLQPILLKHQKDIKRIAQNNHISYLAIFGSHARGEQKPNSDIDLLVSFNKPVDFFEFYDIEQQLSKLFGKKIDLVTTKGLSKHIKPYIQKDLTPIYETA
jgi:uncharacterized protein